MTPIFEDLFLDPLPTAVGGSKFCQPCLEKQFEEFYFHLPDFLAS